MYGLKGVPPAGDQTHTMDWTYLAQPAGPARYNAAAGVKMPAVSATQIKVAGDLTNGGSDRGAPSGPVLAVAPTSFSPWETEFVQIAANPAYDKASNTSTIELQP